MFVCLAKGSVSASTSAVSSKSWQLTLCFLLLACDLYKKCFSSSPVFFLDTLINSCRTLSPPGANRNTPEMAAIILPVCSLRDNLKIRTRVFSVYLFFFLILLPSPTESHERSFDSVTFFHKTVFYLTYEHCYFIDITNKD